MWEIRCACPSDTKRAAAPRLPGASPPSVTTPWRPHGRGSPLVRRSPGRPLPLGARGTQGGRPRVPARPRPQHRPARLLGSAAGHRRPRRVDPGRRPGRRHHPAAPPGRGPPRAHLTRAAGQDGPDLRPPLRRAPGRQRHQRRHPHPEHLRPAPGPRRALRAGPRVLVGVPAADRRGDRGLPRRPHRRHRRRQRVRPGTGAAAARPPVVRRLLRTRPGPGRRTRRRLPVLGRAPGPAQGEDRPAARQGRPPRPHPALRPARPPHRQGHRRRGVGLRRPPAQGHPARDLRPPDRPGQEVRLRGPEPPGAVPPGPRPRPGQGHRGLPQRLARDGTAAPRPRNRPGRLARQRRRTPPGVRGPGRGHLHPLRQPAAGGGPAHRRDDPPPPRRPRPPGPDRTPPSRKRTLP